ncbi:MAG: hypothetical protein KDE19_02165, partial [Caldilineaceae bacterium]|nr:hypothetical protein [Caldilineaceae bacterium]
MANPQSEGMTTSAQEATAAANDTGKTAETATGDAGALNNLTPPLRADSSLAASIAAFDEYMVRKGFSENT